MPRRQRPGLERFGLARRVGRRASGGGPPWWWARYLAADEIAARVRRRFEERD
ncbi:MAG TPA: hypothetical protein VGM69_05480 [Chloroflexota bacterium]